MPFAAHPRSHGEHQEFTPGVELVVGSSPLARGTQPAGVFIIRVRRLIPARAGNTGLGVLWLRIGAAHPRSRGEHKKNAPRPKARYRLIPARAGNTTRFQVVLVVSQAHPRSRGEHGNNSFACHIRPGSSPLARGTHCRIVQITIPRRLIPARAGNTSVYVLMSPPQPAHPRSRGEHVTWSSSGEFGCGSSPLARGTR